jgi:hypothetical protein
MRTRGARLRRDHQDGDLLVGSAHVDREVVEPVSELAALGVEVVIVSTSNLWEAGRVRQIGELVAAVVDL